MLRILQTAVNGKTKVVNKLPEGSKKRGRLALQTAKRQARVEGLTRKLARKLQKEDDQGGGNER